MHSVKSKDGTSIAYFDSGKGMPLLLVHGTTADHTRWTPLLPALGKHFKVFAMDRRGRGSSGDTAPYSVEREFEDVACVIDAIGAREDQPVCVLGHSYGAVCALEAAARARNVRQLILYEPPIPTGKPFYPPALVAAVHELLAEGRREEVISRFFLEVAHIPESELGMLRMLPNWPARIAAAHTIPREMSLTATYAFRPERFAALKAPTLLLLGGDSPPVFKAAIDALSKALPVSRVSVLPGQTHTAMNTAPELFVREVTEFFARTV